MDSELINVITETLYNEFPDCAKDKLSMYETAVRIYNITRLEDQPKVISMTKDQVINYFEFLEENKFQLKIDIEHN